MLYCQIVLLRFNIFDEVFATVKFFDECIPLCLKERDLLKSFVVHLITFTTVCVFGIRYSELKIGILDAMF